MKRVLIILFCVIFALSFMTACVDTESQILAIELLDFGEKYLLDLDYEQAVVHFLKVVKIEPMNPRGYTGAAEAYVGLGETDSAMEILEKGAKTISGNAEIQKLINEVKNNNRNLEESLSPLEIAEHESWRLFDNPLLADEIKFAGIPFWDCSLEDVQNYYPEGHYTYKDSDGIIRDLEDSVYEEYMGWDTNYSTFEIQYATEDSWRYAWFDAISEIRGLSMGMGLDEALSVLGFSSGGTLFVKETGGGVFTMDNGCCSANIAQYGADGGYDYFVGFYYYDALEDRHMNFNVCFKDGGIKLIEIQAE